MKLDNSIIQVASTLFMKFGIKSVSMDDICREAGISKKTIYAKIENKAELIYLVVSDHIMNEKVIIEKMLVDSRDAIDEMIRISEHVLRSLRDIKPSLTYDLKKYYKESWQIIEQLHFRFIKGVIKANIERGITEGIYRSELNPEIISTMYLETSKLTVDEDVFSLRTFTRENLYRQFIRYHMFGVLSEKGMKKYNTYKKVTKNEIGIAI